MKEQIKTELYTSPEVEVIETTAQQVMCESAKVELGQENLEGYTDFEW